MVKSDCKEKEKRTTGQTASWSVLAQKEDHPRPAVNGEYRGTQTLPRKGSRDGKRRHGSTSVTRTMRTINIHDPAAAITVSFAYCFLLLTGKGKVTLLC